MTRKEFKNLKHGDKISMKDGANFIVHNNYRSGEGMVVAVRTEIIHGREDVLWSIKQEKKQIELPLDCGTYQVTIDRKID